MTNTTDPTTQTDDAQYAILTADCDHECESIKLVSLLGHPPESRASEIVTAAARQVMDEHEAETGHAYDLDVEHGAPEAMRERYAELSGEEVFDSE